MGERHPGRSPRLDSGRRPSPAICRKLGADHSTLGPPSRLGQARGLRSQLAARLPLSLSLAISLPFNRLAVPAPFPPSLTLSPPAS